MEKFIKDLPDRELALRFFDDFAAAQPSQVNKLLKNEGLLSDVLTISSYSQLLATTLLQNPNYIWWLGRKRVEAGGRNKEELLESLARFALTNSQLTTQVLLARFRRRELLRIFLRDIRRLATISEIMEEISHLADAILEHALRTARQELENRYGVPLEIDAKGRSKPIEFCIVSLGKLGSRELNYSSDIDLLFIYSAEGSTSDTGTRGSLSNREYSVKLAEFVTKLVGEQTGEGAAYRVDLRLRPNGRIGALATSLRDIVRYYLNDARSWERQVLIRSRGSAGDLRLFKSFFGKVEDRVFSKDVPVEEALDNVRRSKDQINLEHGGGRGFNVKLGRGGIREIEFIAQALQLAYGGRDRWLRSPHTLISLSRLADRDLLGENELTELFDAYDFLRRLEHILQMEHGVQTHTVPIDQLKKSLVARRMDTAHPHQFDERLKAHTENVSRVFSRIFQTSDTATNESSAVEDSIENSGLKKARKKRSSLLNRLPPAILASIEKAERKPEITTEKAEMIERIAATSPRLCDLIASNPGLIDELPDISKDFEARSYREILAKALDRQDFRHRLAMLRQTVRRFLVEIAVFDIFEKITVKDAKRFQTALAEATIDAGFLVVSQELGLRLQSPIERLPLAAMGLGKLGGGGIDYDSDLDLILVYDDSRPTAAGLTHAEFHGKAAELFVTTLSSMTRDGNLYRVDLRLRPHGKNGPSAVSRKAFLEYTASEAAIWELLAYVKLRAAGGDRLLGNVVETGIRDMIHSRAVRIDAADLLNETRRVRLLLESEKTGKLKGKDIDIKYGAGGLLDIYFAMRFLQLKDNVPDDSSDRSTAFMLKKLHDSGPLSDDNYIAFSEGYNFLSNLDHQLRLTVGRTTRLPLANQTALFTIAARMKLASPDDLLEGLTMHRLAIRSAFDDIAGG